MAHDTDDEGTGGAPQAYLELDRAAWAALRAETPLTLTEADLTELRGVNEEVALDEVSDVFLPLSRLLNLRVAATRDLHTVTGTFLGRLAPRVPFVVGIAGSVAVGKSTFARVLRAVLARWPDHPRVELVTTDGFLHPNAVLDARGLMLRKGFPESYDVRRLLRFLAELKSGCPEARAPVYSHLSYDVLDGEEQVLVEPDIVLVEGLNVLQTSGRAADGAPLVVSDFFDFTVYLDAAERDVRRWYVERFLALRRRAFADPRSYFHHFAELSESDAQAVAERIWTTVNEPNLRANIAPTRDRAHVVVEKGPDHRVARVRLRRL